MESHLLPDIVWWKGFTGGYGIRPYGIGGRGSRAPFASALWERALLCHGRYAYIPYFLFQYNKISFYNYVLFVTAL